MAGKHEYSLVYGAMGGHLVHISAVVRGLSCNCHCPECNEPLIAKKGDDLAHHFSHTSDSACNPNPETLTHRFAKELIARQRKAVLPAFEVRIAYENHNRFSAEAWGRQPSAIFEADSAESEYRKLDEVIGVIPDVFLQKGREKLLVEVHFRHPVPDGKIERIKARYLPAVEVCLADLPADCPPERIEHALTEQKRWTWLNNPSFLGPDIHKQLVQSHGLYFPKFQYLPELQCATPQVPVRKLQAAESKMDAAANWIMEARKLSPAERQQAYLAAELDLRLAIHCEYLGISPTRLPMNLMQKTHGQSILKEHAMYWQTWLFSKFCIGERRFSAHEVARAARRVFDSLRQPQRTIQSDNGFSEATSLFYEFLLQLARQNLVTQVEGERSWQHEFLPMAKTPQAASHLLATLPRP